MGIEDSRKYDGRTNPQRLRDEIQRMSPLARTRLNCMRSVIDGVVSNIMPVQFMNTHKHCDAMLAWLIQNRLTGSRFNAWFYGDMEGSLLEMVAELTRRVERDKKRTPVRKDFK